jgi:hypothetical protein
MDTAVAFTQDYSKVSISMGNVKCTRKNQGRPRIKCFWWVERGFIRVFQDKLDNQGSGLLNSLTSEQQYLFNPQKDREGVIRKAAKSSTETPIRTWWITKAWSEQLPLEVPQLSMGFGANSGEH